jgi:uncharacterized membrane protein
MTSVTVRRVLAAISVAWVAFLAIAPAVAVQGSSGTLAYVLAAPAYLVGAVLCHQLPERSFHFGAAQWPVCARCAGIYGGAAVGLVLSASAPIAAMETAAAARARTVIFAAVLPLAATLLYEWVTGIAPANGVRAAAGALLGAIVAWVCVAASLPRRAVGIH